MADVALRQVICISSLCRALNEYLFYSIKLKIRQLSYQLICLVVDGLSPALHNPEINADYGGCLIFAT